MVDVSEKVEPRVQGVQVLSRAADILRLLKMHSTGLTQAEIAVKLGMARTTTHRLLRALEDEGFVQGAAASSRYRLGREIARMAESARAAMVTDMHSLLQTLSDKVGETVDLSVLDKGQAMFIDQVVAAQRLRAVSTVGASFPLHCTANGKAMLAEMPARDAMRILEGRLEKCAPNTCVDPGALVRELTRIQADGVAFDREEHSRGICAVGIAISGGFLGLGAISIPIPAQRFEAKVGAAVKALLDAKRELQPVLRA